MLVVSVCYHIFEPILCICGLDIIENEGLPSMIFRNLNKAWMYEWIGNGKKQDTLLKELLYKCRWLCCDTYADSRKQFI